MYDEEKHWEECTICNEKRNEVVHSFTTTWAWGYESCGENLYTKTCSCGYSESGCKPCVWDGSTYYIDSLMKFHLPKCSVCTQAIPIKYYLYSYGVGDIYYIEDYSDHVVDDVYTWYCRYCRKSDGSIITCSNLGICAECRFNYTDVTHRLYGVNGKIYCITCGKEFGSYDGNVVVNSSTPATYTITDNVALINEAYFHSTKEAHTSFGEYEINTQNVSNLNSTWTTFTLTTITKFRSGFKSAAYPWIHCNIWVEGKQTVLTILDKYNDNDHYYPDLIKPTISNISIDNNTFWSKNKTITILGTENYCDTVKVEILDSEGNGVYVGTTNIDWSSWTNSTPYGSYSISCTPELEAGLEGRTFKVIVTDTCENSTEQEFTISKIDSIPPEVTSNTEVGGDWAKEKSFTAVASDYGIGNVQIAFNDVSDYSLATKNGTEYTREYKLVGDVYSPTKARVFYKDELNNISSQEITIDKIDNTAPTIIGSRFDNNKLILESNDIKEGLGEGSGVTKYRFITSESKLENPEVTKENSVEVLINENIIIPDMVTAKYVYVVAEDLVRKYK